MIRDEALGQLDPKTGAFVPEAESLLDKGDWKQLSMYQQGQSVGVVSPVDKGSVCVSVCVCTCACVCVCVCVCVRACMRACVRE